jgi:hypothetical protein
MPSIPEEHDGTWSWCFCSAADCVHCHPDVAMFIHSVYNNSINELCRILLRCRKHRGYSLNHLFRKDAGEFYGGEAKYVVNGPDVEMMVGGNAGPYKHPHCRWLLDTARAVHVTIDEVDYTLSFGDVFNAPCSQASITVFDLLDGHTPLCEKAKYDFDHMPEFPSFVSLEDMSEMDSRIIAEKFPTATKVWFGPYWTTVMSETKTLLRVPREVVDEMHRSLAGRELTPKTFKEAMGTARRLCRMNKVKAPVTAEELATAIPLVVKMACERVMKDSAEVFDGWYSSSRGAEVNKHNRRLKFLFRTGLQDLVLYVSKKLVYILPALLLFDVVWPLFFYLWTFFANLFENPEVLEIDFVNSTFIGDDQHAAVHGYSNLFVVFAFALASTIYTIVEVPISIINLFHSLAGTFRLVTYPLAGCWWLTLLYLVQYSVALQIQDGQDFLTSVNVNRCTLPYTGPMPYPSIFDAIETQIDASLYPIAEGAIHTRGNTDELEPGPGVHLTGIGFTAAVPVVYSRSKHNLDVAIDTRGVPTVKPPEPGAWDRVDTLVNGTVSYPVLEGHLVRAPIRDERVYGNYDKIITWEYYISRFPPGKRKTMLQAMVKFKDGFFRIAQLAYKGFVKREKIMKVTLNKFIPQRPRLIQGLSIFAKILAGAWFLMYSNALKSVWNVYYRIWYSSGATAEQHNSWLKDVMDELGEDLIYLFTDFSKFDLTQSVEAIDRESKHYVSLGFNDNVEYGQDILNAMKHSKVFSGQHHWSIPGTRKSGDLNTSSGNSKMTGDAMASWLISVGLWLFARTVVLGDDDLTIISREALLRVFPSYSEACASLQRHMTALGFIAKVGLTDNLLEAEYVSCRFYPVAHGKFAFGKKPGRTLTKIGYFMHKDNFAEEGYLAYLHGTLISYLPTANHVPFLRVYVWALLEHLANIAPRFEYDWKYRYTGQLYETSAETWAAFTELYGLTPADEEVFLLNVKQAIAEGLPGMIHSKFVEIMFEIDFSL